MSATKKAPFPVVYLEWDDSGSYNGWHDPGDGVACKIRSIGTLVRSDKKTITISTSHSHYGHYMDQLTIPRVAITKLRKVKLH
jgi:hypothetical protein